jgi:hypothetical protein
LHYRQRRRSDETDWYADYVQSEAHLMLVTVHPVSQPVFHYLSPEFLRAV